MKNTLSIKQFRNNLATVADEVQAGNKFIIIRNSKPAFKVVPLSDTEEDGVWETVVDFTEGGKKKGMKAKDFFDLLDKINKKDK